MGNDVSFARFHSDASVDHGFISVQTEDDKAALNEQCNLQLKFWEGRRALNETDKAGVQKLGVIAFSLRDSPTRNLIDALQKG